MTLEGSSKVSGLRHGRINDALRMSHLLRKLKNHPTGEVAENFKEFETDNYYFQDNQFKNNDESIHLHRNDANISFPEKYKIKQIPSAPPY